jgi:hypothetical protein
MNQASSPAARLEPHQRQKIALSISLNLAVSFSADILHKLFYRRGVTTNRVPF